MSYRLPAAASYNLPLRRSTITLPEAYLAALRPPPKEEGYYVVLTAAEGRVTDDSALADAATRLRLKPAELGRVLEAGQPLPLTRTSTAEEAAMIADGLRELGIESAIVSIEDLHLDLAAKRIRALETSNDLLTGVAAGGGGKVSVRWDEITLVVTGRLLSNRVELEERRRRGRKQTVDSRQLSADESVLDLYARTQDGNWRILAGSFDFSCLGSAKSVTTFANFAALINFLVERAPAAQVDDSYARARPLLETVWPLKPEVRKGEWRRSGAGKVDTTTVTTTDNEAQFTGYSRLRQCLALRELKDVK